MGRHTVSIVGMTEGSKLITVTLPSGNRVDFRISTDGTLTPSAFIVAHAPPSAFIVAHAPAGRIATARKIAIRHLATR